MNDKAKKKKRPTLITWTIAHQNHHIAIELRAGKRCYDMIATAAVPVYSERLIRSIRARRKIDPRRYRKTGATRAATIVVLTTLVMRDVSKKLARLRGDESDDPKKPYLVN